MRHAHYPLSESRRSSVQPLPRQEYLPCRPDNPDWSGRPPQVDSSTPPARLPAAPQKQDIRFISGSASYAFLPVWVLSTRWNGKPYLFVMNGQTGKMIGDLPVDNGKFLLYFLAIALLLFALIFGILSM
jgi:hypothetical protein